MRPGATAEDAWHSPRGDDDPLPAGLEPYSGLICNCSPNVAFEEVDDEEDDVSNCK